MSLPDCNPSPPIFRDVWDFHARTVPHILRATPGIPGDGIFAHYSYDFILEEMNELDLALRRGDVAEVADALGDIQYVVNRMAAIWGIDLRPVHTEIHRANESKVRGGLILRAKDKKIMKGPEYTPPDVAAVLARQKPLF